MRMKKGIALALVLQLVMLVLCSCAAPADETGALGGEPAAPTVKKAEVPDIGDLTLKDDASLYTQYDPLDVVCFYVTVQEGNRADGTDHTFEEVNAYRNLQGMTGVEKIYANAIVQVGDENGPRPGELGYGATAANATINVRGRTSTGYPQKSYRLSLFDDAGTWRNQTAIALNKHPNDPTRLRNMLYYDLLQQVPGMVSLRTQFVHLYIKDETGDTPDDAFVDHGLYTQVELPNARFLRNHGLSRNGNLYKANMCEMYRYPEKLRLATDPEYDLGTFSEVLEPKTGEDHQKLLDMLDAVNDYSRPIEDVIETHFDLDNLTSYLAFNMLMANPDSNAQNYLIYSPVNSDKWYYICWDGDGALAYYEDALRGNTWTEGEWTRGVSDYWAVVLFNRMLRVEGYREALKDKVESLRTIITPDAIAERIARYRTVVDQYTRRMPDSINMRISEDQLELVYENLPYDTDQAYQYFIESLDKPMPFYLGEPAVEEGMLTLEWSPSYDFGGGLIYYDVQIASDWTFEEDTILWESLNQLVPTAQVPLPAAGEYVWRAVARNERGNTQGAFDQFSSATGAHSGMRRLTVTADGKALDPDGE